MPGRVSCGLHLLINVLENFDIWLNLQSREISNFPTHLEVIKYIQPTGNTCFHNILYVYI